LFTTLRQLTADGRGLIFISHKLHEVLALSTRITVLRHGAVTGEVPVEGATRESLANMMVGREVKLRPDKLPAEPGEVALEIRGLTVMGDRGVVAVDDLDLDVRKGEILGIAGVSGNGQRELAETIAGLRSSESGTIKVAGTDVTGALPKKVRQAGLAYVPEERMREGAIGGFTVWENLLMIDHASPDYLKHGMFDFGRIKDHSRELVEAFDVRTPSLETSCGSLSGGNIQKLIEFLTGSTAILMISGDLDEVFGLSDRIAVMYEGKIIGIVDPETATREEVGLMMAGVGAD
jgi:simple sugar transport system ATP-binding protein